MKFAIIAAGEGSRLSNEGACAPKPLIKINGEYMIDRLIRIFTENGAEEVVVIVNCLTNLVKDHLLEKYDVITDDGSIKHDTAKGPSVRLVCKTTPSSMHSFYEISRYLRGDKFCLTTVDTIFREQEFKQYISVFEKSGTDGLMAVTSYVDDEKPLYVDVDDNMNIVGFCDENNGYSYVSGGIYCLTSKAIDTLEFCIKQNQSRMRNFQRQLIKDDSRLIAYPFDKIVDVDHVDDISKAENFLAEK